MTSYNNAATLTHAEYAAIWERVDYNGNGLLSLAELDKAVVEIWPNLNHKPAIMRAYKAADKNDDGFIKKNEFRFFVRFIHYYNELWTKFESIDDDGDRRLTKSEFQQAATMVGLDDPDAVFEEIDSNDGGVVLFDEFCSWMAKRENNTE
jgi:Ca2+-binding EF-hand superfamily protein